MQQDPRSIITSPYLNIPYLHPDAESWWILHSSPFKKHSRIHQPHVTKPNQTGLSITRRTDRQLMISASNNEIKQPKIKTRSTSTSSPLRKDSIPQLTSPLNLLLAMMDAHQEFSLVHTKMQILGQSNCVNTIIPYHSISYHIISSAPAYMHNFSLSTFSCLANPVPSSRLPGGLADEDQEMMLTKTKKISFLICTYFLPP